MIGRRDPVSAGRVYEFKCQAVGARPAPAISWWRGSTQLRENVTNNVRSVVQCMYTRVGHNAALTFRRVLTGT